MTFKRFEGDERFRGEVNAEALFDQLTFPELFKRFNCAEWIAAFRQPPTGQLDVDATAEIVGTPLVRESTFYNGGASAFITGLGKDYGKVDPHVHLDNVGRIGLERTSFGHELGHLFLASAAGLTDDGIRPRSEEEFCDYFGRQFALPLSELDGIESVTPAVVAGLVEAYGIEPMDAFHQLMLKGLLPRRFKIETSMGEEGRGFFRNKVTEVTVCLDCELEQVHEHAKPETRMLVFNYAAYDWAHHMPFNHCDGDDRLDPDRLARLSKKHGRWTEEDEANLAAQRIRHTEHIERMTRAFATRAFEIEDF